MQHMVCARVCGVEGRRNILSGQFFFVCEKNDREESSTKSLGGMTRPKDEMGSQIVSSESDISHLILVYLSRNNNSQAQARRFPALTAPEPEFAIISVPSEIRWRVCGAREAPAPRDSLNFWRASLLSRNEFESGTFTIVLHVTFSFTYVSVNYGANFSFKGELNPEMKLCELLVLGHCIHLPLILFACASSGESYNADSPVPPNFVTPLTQRWLGTLLRFEVFWTFIEKYFFDPSRLPVSLSLP